MTSLCGGGTSGPKTGVAAVVDYSSGLIASILAARGVAWLIPVIPLAGLPPLVLSTFCGTDPPAVPSFTSAETLAMLTLNFGADFDSGLFKLKDLILHSIWYDACQCTSGSPTTFPTVTIPSGTPIVQPPAPGAGVPCITLGNSTFVNSTSGVTFIAGTTGVQGKQNLMHVQLVTSGLGGGPFTTVDLQWHYRDVGSVVNTNFGSVRTIAANQTYDFYDLAPTINPAVIELDGTANNANTGIFVTSTLDDFCNGAPGTQTPCCPPDQSTQSYLDLILQTVTLIQRQAVPFAYIASTVHSGLSGAGVLSVSGLIGAKIVATTLPSSYGASGTSPTEHFDLGFITWGTADGYPQSLRLEHSPQISLPARASAFTDLAYDLAPGVVATITELLREP